MPIRCQYISPASLGHAALETTMPPTKILLQYFKEIPQGAGDPSWGKVSQGYTSALLTSTHQASCSYCCGRQMGKPHRAVTSCPCMGGQWLKVVLLSWTSKSLPTMSGMEKLHSLLSLPVQGLGTIEGSLVWTKKRELFPAQNNRCVEVLLKGRWEFLLSMQKILAGFRKRKDKCLRERSIMDH